MCVLPEVLARRLSHERPLATQLAAASVKPNQRFARIQYLMQSLGASTELSNPIGYKITNSFGIQDSVYSTAPLTKSLHFCSGTRRRLPRVSSRSASWCSCSCCLDLGNTRVEIMDSDSVSMHLEELQGPCTTYYPTELFLRECSH